MSAFSSSIFKLGTVARSMISPACYKMLQLVSDLTNAACVG